METTYVGIYKNNELQATIQWPSTDEPPIELIDNLHDNGYELVSITKEEYDEVGWDELTIEEIKNGKYYWE